MKKRRLAILIACGLTSLAAGKLMAEDLEDELAKLQGEWVSVSFEAARVPKNSQKLTLVIKGKKIDMKVNDKVYKADCDLNVEEDPKWMDIVERDHLHVHVISENKGIYKLDGDTLTICHGAKIRPTKFEVRDGEFLCDSLIVLKRMR
jgi:uncharacterized protein (TIGR03067 family)